ncbi:hypothetical protein D3C84_1172620 [compost metagenome]
MKKIQNFIKEAKLRPVLRYVRIWVLDTSVSWLMLASGINKVTDVIASDGIC